MPWYRTSGGRLIHGEGGLAAVYAANGWAEVPDEQALAEVTSGQAQERADVEGEAAAQVDARDLPTTPTPVPEEEPTPDPSAHTVVDANGTGLLTTKAGDPELTDEQRADVDRVIDEEGPRGSLRHRR